MKRRRMRGVVTLMVLASLLGAQAAVGQGLATLLPRDKQAGTWRAADKPDEYGPEDLYLYIDGGAEIYLEYGFARVISQDYAGPGGRTISLEIFKMSDPAAAFGMYSFKTSREGRSLGIGWQARLEGYYLNFRKSEYVVTLTGPDDSQETVDGLLSLARAVDENIPGRAPAEEPDVVRRFPGEGRVEGSLKYFRGPLGLFNTYPFAASDVLRFKDAAWASYSAGYDVGVLAYPDAKACQERAQAALTAFRSDSRFTGIVVSGGDFFMKDGKSRLILFHPSRDHLVIVVGAEGQEAARRVAVDAAGRYTKPAR
jgi:hypothetical protein